jgi:two-component system, NtrC family, sensor histidine kinase KinB
MKHSIRSRFALGMTFLFLIILILSVFSGYYLNKLSSKNSAILKENYLSVVYARDMSEGVRIINREVTTCFLEHRKPDSLKVYKALGQIDKSFQAAKNNITESGENDLVSGIEEEFTQYRNSVNNLLRTNASEKEILLLQDKSGKINEKLLILSQINGSAMETKTEDAKAYSKRALTQMTVLATICFIVGLSFTFSFSSYFRQRFNQLYDGIKEIASNNYDQHLYVPDEDEFYEISLVFNEMADKLKEKKQKMSVTLLNEKDPTINRENLDELKRMLIKIKSTEEEVTAVISKIERKTESNDV